MEHVLRLVIAPRARVGALFAAVFLQCRVHRESLAAVVAPMFAVLGVQCHVIRQLVAELETLAAIGASVRAHVAMYGHVFPHCESHLCKLNEITLTYALL